MPTESDVLIKYIENEQNPSYFPVVLRTQFSSRRSNKRNTLRRNTPLDPSHNQYKQPDPRTISKRGRVRVYFRKIPQKSLQYVKDLWNTLVDMQWRWLIAIVTIVNIIAYVTCGILFYLDAWMSGDFDSDSSHGRCVQGIDSLLNFFMLGIETITTTGYGYLHPTEYCHIYFMVLTFSTITSILIDGAFISVVYAKLNRPKLRNIHGQVFTKKAVVSLRNGHLCLVVRVNDQDLKHGIGTEIKMFMVKGETNEDGYIVPNYITELQVKPYGMLFWPIDIIHEITCESPLWTMSAKELMTQKRLEIVVVVSGSSIKTGQSTRSQTSYLNKEIMWGYQFSPCLDYDSKKKGYMVNKKTFNETVLQEVPLCSAKALQELQQQIENFRSREPRECNELLEELK
ncbi:hypothetical protein ABEB36_007383 [Hypothenemus hampei]|uniref:Uncharacterized protein n=1 Tax=Hypothenemus hampei TaxID=57062 RepID=A0ABD1ETS7_HYPHA